MKRKNLTNLFYSKTFNHAAVQLHRRTFIQRFLLTYTAIRPTPIMPIANHLVIYLSTHVLYNVLLPQYCFRLHLTRKES